MVDNSADQMVAPRGETTVVTMEAYWAGRKAALTDAPWVGDSVASRGETTVVTMVTYWAGRKAALSDAPLVGGTDASTV